MCAVRLSVGAIHEYTATCYHQRCITLVNRGIIRVHYDLPRAIIVQALLVMNDHALKPVNRICLHWEEKTRELLFNAMIASIVISCNYTMISFTIVQESIFGRDWFVLTE